MREGVKKNYTGEHRVCKIKQSVFLLHFLTPKMSVQRAQIEMFQLNTMKICTLYATLLYATYMLCLGI